MPEDSSAVLDALDRDEAIEFYVNTLGFDLLRDDDYGGVSGGSRSPRPVRQRVSS